MRIRIPTIHRLCDSAPSRLLLALVAVWGLLAAPELCRAGLLVTCSAPSDCAERCDCAGAMCGEESHDCGGSEDCCRCVQACKTISVAPPKTSISLLNPTETGAIVSMAAVFELHALHAVIAASPCASSPDRYPRPPSDRPLLI